MDLKSMLAAALKAAGQQGGEVLVVTRHQGLIDLLAPVLAELGYDMKVVAHASAEAVRGQVVVGVLPLHLAAEAAAVVAVDLRLRPEDRGRDLTAAEVAERVAGVTAYAVTRLA